MVSKQDGKFYKSHLSINYSVIVLQLPLGSFDSCHALWNEVIKEG